MIKIPVSASRKYDVIMQRGALSDAGTYIMQALGLAEVKQKKICIVTDANVDVLYGQPEHALWRSLERSGFEVFKYVFPGGEKTKTMDTVAAILNFLADNSFTRSDILLALGGGITGDVTGYTAASFLRGVEFIQIPTTLLATVDSSVGGKTGVNLNAGKNLAGAFWQPSLVLFDPDVLSTLSRDLKLDGVAEAIKAGYIADPSIIETVSQVSDAAVLTDDDFLTQLAAKAVEVKRQVVEEDERESGVRQLLNLGHTIAHAIEKCSNYEITHGHAVAMGMVIVSNAADTLSWSEDPCSGSIRKILEDFRFPLEHPYTPEELTRAALQDKKRRGGNITLVIPAKAGKCVLRTIPVTDLEEFIACGMKKGS